ncbi:hypothetical protein GCM10009530_39650 [Microbispora corallina]|uniref:HTH cro/C1-type domain-containing protein n=1 Tax=Microbispora corallina TaxID=83302 RepID=A0ABQ4G8P7_9ACTN|nr:helix-turn-helix domain-containing protein [Microbispora corallina]GIH43438.1 hypothetical protein Mco01_64380 [Microbispora corallina]
MGIDPARIQTGEQLREQLQELFHSGGWSVHRLADKARLSAATVQGIVKGTTRLPQTRTLRKIVKACGQDPEPWVAARGRAIQAAKQLVASDPRFGGRHDDITALDKVRAEFRRQDRPCVIVLFGSPGVGKTMLAEQWAARVCESGIFIGKALEPLNLRGFSAEGPLTRTDVAKALLQRLGVSSDLVPREDDECARMIRRHLEASSHLLLLDNVGETEAIRDFLPKVGTSIVVITSRGPLIGFGVKEYLVRREVRRLSPDGSLELLTRWLPERGDTELDDRERVAELCFHLPLALGIVASRLASDRELRFQDVAEQLEWRGTLRALGGTRSEETNLETVYSWSYNALTPAARRIYRLLTLRLGEGIDAYAVALTGGIGLAEADEMIREFRDTGLITSRGKRFDIHDLLYDFALARRIQEEEPGAAFEFYSRVLPAYYGCVNHAFNVVNKQNPMVDAEFLADWRNDDGTRTVGADPASASRWFGEERANLVHLATAACELVPPPSEAPRLAFALFYFLDIQHHWGTWASVIEAGLRSADALNDLWSKARLLRDSGRLRYVRIRDLHDRLHDSDSGDTAWRADALTACSEATGFLNASADHYRRHGGHPDEAIVVQRELADVSLEVAKLSRRQEAFTLAINRYRAVEDMWKRSTSSVRDVSLLSLQLPMSEAYRLHGDLDAAQECLKTARDMLASGAVSHANLEPHLYRHEAALNEARGDLEAAAACWDRTVALFGDTEERWLHRARALAQRGLLLSKLGNRHARDSLQDARNLLDKHDSPEAAVVQTWLDRLSERSSPAH